MRWRADLQFKHGFFRVLAHIWDGGTRHEVEEGQDQGGTLAQDVVGFTAVGAEVAVVGAVTAPHCLHHGCTQLHGGRERLGITPCMTTSVAKQYCEAVPKRASSSCYTHVREHEVTKQGAFSLSMHVVRG